MSDISLPPYEIKPAYYSLLTRARPQFIRTFMSPAWFISKDCKKVGEPFSNPREECSGFMGPKLETASGVQRPDKHISR